MSLVLKDRVKEQTTTTGTGTVSLGGAVSGFQTFSSGVGDGNTTYYAIVSQTADEWEVGLGTYTSAGSTLSRDTILNSSNAGSAVNFSAGTKDVFVTYAADKAIYRDAAGEVSVTRATSATYAVSADFAASATNATTAINVDGGTVSSTDGTFNTLIVVTSASVGGTFNVGGNVGIGVTTVDTALSTKLHVAGTIRTDTGAAAANPAIVFDHDNFADADANYIMLDRTSEDMRFNVNASERLRITSSGNVGIGTSSPVSKLDVVGDGARSVVRASTAASDVRLEAQASDYWSGTTYTGTALIQYGSTATGTTAGLSNADLGVLRFQNGSSGLIYTNGLSPIIFGTYSTERMRIDSSGNVGIGVTVPTFKLDVRGTTNSVANFYQLTAATNTDIYVNNVGSANNFLISRRSSGESWLYNSGADPLVFHTNAAERMRIDSSGNVGIGTSSPTRPLEVLGNHAINASALIRSSGSTPNFCLQLEKTQGTGDLGNWTALYINGNDNVSYESRIQFGFDSIAVGSIISSSRTGAGETDLRFYTTNAETTSERLRIDSSGNVGIGTASPAAKLHSSVSSSGASVAGGVSVAAFLEAATNTWVQISSGTGSPAYLSLGDAADIDAFRLAAQDGYAQIAASGASDYLRFDTGGYNERMRIDSSGNVGIGTSSPSQKVDITTATAAATSAIWTGSNLTLRDTTSFAENVGGAIMFEGKFNTAGSYSAYGFIRGAKATGVDGASAGDLILGARAGDISFVSSAGLTDGTGELVRILSSGNVVIGATAARARLHVDYGISDDSFTALLSTFRPNLVFEDRSGSSTDFQFFLDANAFQIRYGDASTDTKLTSEAMRIDSSGNLLVGQTATSAPGFNNTTEGGAWSSSGTSLHLSRVSNAVAWLNRSTTTGTIQSFRYDGSAVGSISVTASATAYNTSSDYRLKENVVALNGAIDRVKLLKPSRFNFIIDPDTTVDGFVAHEVSGIVPEAVHGAKDAVDADGNPEYQGIDQSKLVPLLTAALQEALAKIDALEARVAALETA